MPSKGIYHNFSENNFLLFLSPPNSVRDLIILVVETSCTLPVQENELHVSPKSVTNCVLMKYECVAKTNRF